MNGDLKKILIYRLGLLGDTIVALPAIKTIRENFPLAKITLLYNKYPMGVCPTEILTHSELVDEYVCYRREKGIPEFIKLWKSIKNSQYDAVIYLAPTRRNSFQVLRDELFFKLAGIKKLIGFDYSYSNRKAAKQVANECDALLCSLKAAGLKVSEEIIFSGLVKVKSEDKDICEAKLSESGLIGEKCGKMVAFGIGSNMPAKKWAQDNFFKLGQELIETADIVPLIVGGAGEQQAGEMLVRKWGRGINLAGRLSIVQSYYVLTKCRFYVGNDNGAMHLAVLAGLKCVAIFSSRDIPGKWDPYGPGHIVLRKNVPCEGCMLPQCGKGEESCIEQICVQEVFDACMVLLENALCLSRT